MSLGKAIRDLRESRKISQKDFAEKIDISPIYLCNIEKDKAQPSFTVLEKISFGFDVPVAVINYMSLNRYNVAEHKRETFDMLSPVINKMISEIFEL